MAVSQRQIAEKLGVSIALVSRVLSGKAAEIGITEETIKKVLRTADEMGYVPSAAALSLIGKSTRTIGIAVYDFIDPFFGSLIKEIQTQAHEHNYTLMLAGFLNRIPDRQDLQAFHKHRLDGLIIIGTDPAAHWLDDFSQLPVARIGHGGSQEKSTRISIDERSAADQLIQHLLKRGRKSAAFIASDLPAHAIRRQFIQEAAEAGAMHLDCFKSDMMSGFDAGRDQTRKLLGQNTRIDSIICATDRVAMGALHALAEAKIAVPQTIALTGFDDIPAASQFIPPITTIRQPVKAMVQQAFAAVIEKEKPSRYTHEGTLVIRETA